MFGHVVQVDPDSHGDGATLQRDQDEALAFYTEKIGMEVRADVTLPRWATFGGSP